MRRQQIFCAVTLMGLLWSPLMLAQAQGAAPVRVADLAQDIGKSVTVVGRTGYLVSQYDSSGLHVFTLRDDYDGQVLVRDIGGARPVMGITYQITGTPTRINGTLFLETASGMLTPVYPAAAPVPPPVRAKSQPLLWASLFLSIAALAIALFAALRRWTRSPAPAWGVLSVTSGPDRGMNVPLHRRRTVIGRGVSPAHDIRMSGGDPTISNRHAQLIFQRGALSIQDLSSNGTRIGGEKLMPGKVVPVNSGDLIHIGTRGTVVIVRLNDVSPAQGLLKRLHRPVSAGDKTVLLPELRAEGPAWRKAVGSPSRAARSSDQEGAEPENGSLTPPLSPLIFTFSGETPRDDQADEEE